MLSAIWIATLAIRGSMDRESYLGVLFGLILIDTAIFMI